MTNNSWMNSPRYDIAPEYLENKKTCMRSDFGEDRCKCKKCSHKQDCDWDKCKCDKCSHKPDYDWDKCKCDECHHEPDYDNDKCKCDKCSHKHDCDFDKCKCDKCSYKPDYDDDKFDKYPHKKTGFCYDDMKKVLELLIHQTRNCNVSINNFGFIGKYFTVGTRLYPTMYGNDNIYNLSGVFESLDPYSNIIKINNNYIYYPIPEYSSDDKIEMSVSSVPLASLDSIAIDYSSPDDGYFINELQKYLNPKHEDNHCHCSKPKEVEYFCTDEILHQLFTPYSFSKKVNLTAGWLVLYQALVLGKIGDILILASDSSNVSRIYLVRMDFIGFLGTNPTPVPSGADS